MRQINREVIICASGRFGGLHLQNTTKKMRYSYLAIPPPPPSSLTEGGANADHETLDDDNGDDFSTPPIRRQR